MTTKIQKYSKWFVGFSVILMLFLSACSGGSEQAGKTVDSQAGQPVDGAMLMMASLEGAPAEVQSAPVMVQDAYRFAIANPDVMQHIPCYCGCGAMGHTSNYSCYVSGTDADGKITYDSHALGCGICVDITQDTMRLLKGGKRISEIKSYVDQTYAQYGPSNIEADK